MKVKQWCQVSHGAAGMGVSARLLVREVEMGALPDGDETSCIGLWFDPEEGEDGYMASVKRRYWDNDGTANLELLRIDVDPVGPLLEHYEHKPQHLLPRYSMAWYTDTHGDPVPLMLASGWIEYKP